MFSIKTRQIEVQPPPDGSEADKGRRPALYKNYKGEVLDPLDTYNKFWEAQKRLGLWVASISGPWYDDSNPEVRGQTEEDAKRKALEDLKDMYKELEMYLKEQGVQL